jgi:hypothetical protein
MVSAMTPADQERARIRAILDAVDDTLRGAAAEYEPGYDEPEPARPWGSTPDILDYSQRSSEPMRRWRAEAEKAEAKRAQEREMTTNELNAQRTRDWEAWADARIEAALNAALKTKGHDLFDTLVGLVSELRQQWRAELNAQIGQLRAELGLNDECAVDKNTVIDLPAFPLRRKSDAA